jgi:hypothetical protein
MLLIILVFSSCNDKTTLYINDKNTDPWPSYWEYECLPEGYLSLIDTDETLSSKLFSIVGGGTYYYKFKAEKPGEFTLCWVYYEHINWLRSDKSYAVDYVINDKLEIKQVGEKHPIYEFEKYDKHLFEQYVYQYSLDLEWVLNETNYEKSIDKL